MSQLTTLETSQKPPTSGLTFALFAPGKKSVCVVGSFNHFEPDADCLKAEDDGWWRLTKELAAGEHKYRFVVDGQVICDPLATELADDPNDEKLPPLAVLRVGEEPFVWRHDGWQRPGFADLVMYEMHVADFTPEGTLNAARQRLDYLADLGVNAIELMPVNETELAEGWGYQTTYYQTVRRRSTSTLVR